MPTTAALPTTPAELAAIIRAEGTPPSAFPAVYAPLCAEIGRPAAARMLCNASQLVADGTDLATRVRRALGFRHIARTLGPAESATSVSVWSVRELQDVYAHVGGTVTARPVTRRLPDDGTTYSTIEVSLVAEIDGLGTVAVHTDWAPADEAHGWVLPVIQAVTSA